MENVEIGPSQGFGGDSVRGKGQTADFRPHCGIGSLDLPIGRLLDPVDLLSAEDPDHDFIELFRAGADHDLPRLGVDMAVPGQIGGDFVPEHGASLHRRLDKEEAPLFRKHAAYRPEPRGIGEIVLGRRGWLGKIRDRLRWDVGRRLQPRIGDKAALPLPGLDISLVRKHLARALHGDDAHTLSVGKDPFGRQLFARFVRAGEDPGFQRPIKLVVFLHLVIENSPFLILYS